MVKKKGRFIPYIIVAFFILIAVSDISLFIVAKDTFTGLVTENPYQKGIDFGKINDRQKDLVTSDWQGDISYQNKEITFSLADKQGNPVDDAKVLLKVISPVTDKYDRTIEMRKSKGGLYKASYLFPKQGRWDIKIKAVKEKRQYFDHKRILYNNGNIEFL